MHVAKMDHTTLRLQADVSRPDGATARLVDLFAVNVQRNRIALDGNVIPISLAGLLFVSRNLLQVREAADRIWIG